MTTLLVHLPAALLVIFRIGGLMLFAPVFGSNIIPVRIRILLAFVLGVALYPVLHSVGAVSPEGLSLDLVSLAPLVAIEVLVGVTIGLIASLPLVAMQMGGLLMGQQMGLGFAMLYNPAMGDDGDVVGQLFFFLALAGFLIVSGHEAIVTAVLHSFGHVPLGAFVFDAGTLTLITGLLLSSFEVALRVAAPVIAIIFLQSIAMGFVSRTVPQLNILSLGFPLRILVGFTVMLGGLVVIAEVGMEAIDDTFETLMYWVGNG